jgi:hypothetical protein
MAGLLRAQLRFQCLLADDRCAACISAALPSRARAASILCHAASC